MSRQGPAPHLYFTHSSPSLAPECPHLNSAFFHSSSSTCVPTNQDPAPFHPRKATCESSSHPPLLVLSWPTSVILNQKHKYRLQSDVCVRQQQPQRQLRALAAPFCLRLEVPVSRLLKSPHTASRESLWPLLPIQTSHTTLEQGLVKCDSWKSHQHVVCISLPAMNIWM